MKVLRKIFKLLPPAFVVQIWLDRRYGIKVKPAPWGGLAGIALAVLPYAFTAALSVRMQSDRRLLKYFFPYGKMKRYVHLAYRMEVGDDAKDHGVVGKFRAIMPYGLVLWWDADDRRAIKGKVNDLTAKVARKVRVDWHMPEKERVEFAHLDKIETMALRLMIMTSGGKNK